MKITEQELVMCWIAIDEYIKKLENYGESDIDDWCLLKEKIKKMLTRRR
jgi:hypothetical protein